MMTMLRPNSGKTCMMTEVTPGVFGKLRVRYIVTPRNPQWQTYELRPQHRQQVGLQAARLHYGNGIRTRLPRRSNRIELADAVLSCSALCIFIGCECWLTWHEPRIGQFLNHCTSIFKKLIAASDGVQFIACQAPCPGGNGCPFVPQI